MIEASKGEVARFTICTIYYSATGDVVKFFIKSKVLIVLIMIFILDNG